MTIGKDMAFMSADGRSDFSMEAYKNMSIDPDKLTARFEQLTPYFMAYWDPCRKAV